MGLKSSAIRCVGLYCATLTVSLACIGIFDSHLLAQVTGATLTGTVSDSSGSVLPNAVVSIHNLGTGANSVVTTNASGIYSAPNLQPGQYDVNVAAKGFGDQALRGLTLTVGETQVLNVSMKIGQVMNEVEVADVAPDVNLGSSTIGAVNGEAMIEELPLNGRSWTDLANLQPGIYAIKTQPDLSTHDRSQRGYGAQISISGSRPQQNNYRLDGISINDPTNGAPGSVLGGNLGVDAIAEFSILTANYSAEYGRASGGVLNAITKSGTNRIHGTVYEFLRNSALDARNYFDLKKPPFERNQFGGSVGGAIEKDKTFFFVDYEGLRQRLSLSQVSIVPSQAARNGMLSTGSVSVDPEVLRFLKAFYPLPNEPNPASPDTGFFVFGQPQNTTENYFTIRLDHNFSDKDSIHATYMYDFADVLSIDEFKNKSFTTLTHRQLATVEASHLFNPSFINTVRFGFHKYDLAYSTNAKALNPAIADTSYGFAPGDSAGQIVVTGLTTFTGGLTAATPILNYWNSWQGYDEASLTKGKHTLKFGGGLEWIQDHTLLAVGPGGIIVFPSESAFFTNQPVFFTAALNGGYLPRNARQYIFGLYVGDDVRLRRNLTLNIGLRYEPTTVPSEIHGKVASLSSLYDTIPRLGNPLFHNNTLHDFDPRIGFAWDPFGNGKTSVRAGFGIYDQLPLIPFVSQGISLTDPFFKSGNAGGPQLPQGSFPTGAYQIVSNNSNSSRVAFIQQHPKRGYVLQWNLNVQRELLPKLTGLIGYVGNHGVHGITQTDDADIVLPTLTAQGYEWPTPSGSGTKLNPSIGRLPAVLWRNSSLYDGLELQLTKRMSHGLQIQGSYTWSKSIDTASGGVVGDTFVNGISSLFIFDPRLTRALSDFNAGRVLSINLLWQLPNVRTLGFLNPILSRWQMGAIFSASDGVPFTPFMAPDPLGLNSSDPFAYPNRLRTPNCKNPSNPGNVNEYIKLQCFAPPNPLTRLGNTGRNSIIGPGLSELDYSLVKNIAVPRISEAFNVQFRAEFFNILNHANFQPPIDNATLFDPTGVPVPGAGLIDKTATTSRQTQFGLKLIW